MQIAAPQHRVARSHLNGHVGRGHACDPLAGYIIFEAGRRPLAGRVIEHAFVCDRGEGDHSIDGQRLPGLQAIFELLGKHLGVGRGLENLLHNFPGNLVLPVAVGHSANESGGKYLWPFAAHRQHRVVEHTVMAPPGEGLLLSFREAEVRPPCPKAALPRSIR